MIESSCEHPTMAAAIVAFASRLKSTLAPRVLVFVAIQSANVRASSAAASGAFCGALVDRRAERLDLALRVGEVE